MKSLLLSVLSLALCLGCVSQAPGYFSIPEEEESDGVRVTVIGLMGAISRPMGVTGTIENISDDPIRLCRVYFTGYGMHGQITARAKAEVFDLEPGHSHSFKARFKLPTPDELSMLQIGEIEVER